MPSLLHHVLRPVVFRGGHGGQGLQPEIDGVAHAGVLEAEVKGFHPFDGDAVVARLRALLGEIDVVFQVCHGLAVGELFGFGRAGEDVEVAVCLLLAVGLAGVEQLAEDVGGRVVGFVKW